MPVITLTLERPHLRRRNHPRLRARRIPRRLPSYRIRTVVVFILRPARLKRIRPSALPLLLPAAPPRPPFFVRPKRKSRRNLITEIDVNRRFSPRIIPHRRRTPRVPMAAPLPSSSSTSLPPPRARLRSRPFVIVIVVRFRRPADRRNAVSSQSESSPWRIVNLLFLLRPFPLYLHLHPLHLLPLLRLLYRLLL